MHKLFAPRSVLVVGASSRPGNMGANIVRNLITIGFAGRIHILGRRPGHLFGHAILTSWDQVPDGIDLAAVLVPAAEMATVIRECAARSIRRLVIESGGFGEQDAEGRSLQDELVVLARELGVRFVGPNGIGVIDPVHRLAVPFMAFPRFPRPGRIHVLAQSGGVGIAYLNRLMEEGLGVGSCVSMGNKLDVDECDLLDYLRGQDPQLVCLYLEDIRSGRRFFEATRRFPCPIVVQKANVSAAGAQAAASHTAAVAVDDRLVDALLRQNRVPRVRDMAHMMIMAKAFSLPPLQGDRLLLVSRSGGHAVIAADFMDRHGFELPPLDPEVEAMTRAALRAKVIEPHNPLDLGDVFDLEVYRRIIEQGMASPNFDGVVFIHTYGVGPEQGPSRQLVREIAGLSRQHGKPLFVAMVAPGSELAKLRQMGLCPIFDGPEEAMEAAAASRRGHAVTCEQACPPLPLPALSEPDAVDERLRAAPAGLMPAHEALALVRDAGISVAPFRLAERSDQVAELARELGFPLVMKLLVHDMPHKSDQGGVVLGVQDAAEAVEVDGRLRALAAELAPQAPMDGVLLQRMEPGFREVFLGGRNDPSFGPVVLVGLGGVLVEVFKDISVRLAPLCQADVDDLLSEPLSFRALRGARGIPPADREFLQDAILRVSALLLAHPRIEELDINPIKLHRAGRGGTAVDARVVLGPPLGPATI